MVARREFVLTLAGSLITNYRFGQVPIPARQQRSFRSIDGLGEVRIEYPTALLDAVLSAGTRTCVVTVGNPGLYGAAAFDDVVAEIEAYERHIDNNPTRLSRVRSVADIDRAVATGTIGLVYYPQNATPIQDDLSRLEVLYDLGVRIVQLTYNHRNLLGDGCLERTNAGLSRFGVEAVERMNELNMLVDVSHCGEATTMDGISFSREPVAITHSGCKAVYEHPRNKSDAALGAMAERGGVIGIYQLNPNLGPNERNTLEDYLDHIDHAVNVAGIDHVGIGSDREHRTIPDTPEEKQKLVDELSRLAPITAAEVRWPFFLSELNHPRRMETVADGLARRGRTNSEIENIMWENFYRLFSETFG